MRFIAAYYLMLIYVTVVAKPLIPFIRDEWAHQFNEIEHISTVHAKYGSNHLEKELAGTDAGNDKNQNQTLLRSEDQVPFHVPVQECKFDRIINESPLQYSCLIPNKLPFVCIPNQGEPPEFS